MLTVTQSLSLFLFLQCKRLKLLGVRDRVNGSRSAAPKACTLCTLYRKGASSINTVFQLLCQCQKKKSINFMWDTNQYLWVLFEKQLSAMIIMYLKPPQPSHTIHKLKP